MQQDRGALPGRALSLMDIALGGGPAHLLTFGRFAMLPTWDAAVPAEPAPRTPPAVAAPADIASAPPPPKLQYASTRVHPAQEEANSRHAALATWTDIVSAFKGAPTAFIELRGDVNPTSLEPYMATRRTGTLPVRASAWRLFLKWAEDKCLDVESIGEPMVFDYLTHLRASAAPATRADNFLRACHFAFGLCGLSVGHAIAMSARC